MNRKPGLDGVRGAAVLTILTFHLINNSGILAAPGLPEFFQLLTRKLWLGVDLFFVLSGFLIGGTLIATRHRPDYYASFLVRRAARILPIYYLWVGLFLGLRALGAERIGGGFSLLFGVSPIPGWAYLTFTQNFIQAFSGWGPAWVGVTWSLAIEIHFYLTAVLLVRYVPSRFLALACCSVIVAVNIFRLLAVEHFGNHALLVLTPCRLDSPFVGVLCAWIAAHWNEATINSKFGSYPKTVAIAFAAACYLGFTFGPQERVEFLLMMALMPFAFGLIVLAFAAAPTESVCGGPAKFLRWIGVRCYAIYLFHQTVVHVLAHITYGTSAFFQPGQGTLVIAAAFAFTFALAGLSWHYLERPIIDAARRLTARTMERATANDIRTRKASARVTI